MYSAVYTVPGLLFITISRPTEPLQLPWVPLLAMLEQELVEVVGGGLALHSDKLEIIRL